ncbi:MAG: hypothetical protein V3U92_00955 [Cellulophaga sp.]
MKKIIQITAVICIALIMSCSSDDAEPIIVPEPVSFPEIPNGDFESWRVETKDHLTGTEVNYDVPNEWTEFFINDVLRFTSGHGFFNKYDYPTGDGSALLLERSFPGASESKNNGFVRFNCITVPNKLTGRYKFIGSSLASTGIVDTLRIAVHFSKIIDTLTTLNLHNNVLPDRARYITIIEPTENFNYFEIDVSEFIDQEIDYATIQLIMKMGDSGLDAEYSSAIIDDLKFE